MDGEAMLRKRLLKWGKGKGRKKGLDLVIQNTTCS